MKTFHRLAAVALTAGAVIAASGFAYEQGAMSASARPYHNGSVWEVAFIRVKPGMDEAYRAYICGQWKAEQEAMKKEGLVMSYKVLTTESHSGTDFNMLLMTEYKDLASMEANEAKGEAIAQKVLGDDQKQMQGYKDRSEIREIMGNRLSRELILEPKK